MKEEDRGIAHLDIRLGNVEKLVSEDSCNLSCLLVNVSSVNIIKINLRMLFTSKTGFDRMRANIHHQGTHIIIAVHSPAHSSKTKRYFLDKDQFIFSLALIDDFDFFSALSVKHFPSSRLLASFLIRRKRNKALNGSGYD